jgi:7-cyano-7-deazaguanine synthase
MFCKLATKTNSLTPQIKLRRCSVENEKTRTGGVLLMSGGVESSALLFYLVNQYKSAKELHKIENTIFPIFANYGQRSSSMELEASQYMCNAVGLKLEIIDLNLVGEFFRSKQKMKRHVPIPHRNLFILSLALGYCSELISEVKNSEHPFSTINLHLGLNSEDLNKSNYQSGTQAFVNSFSALSHILDSNVKIQTPLVQYSKQEIISTCKRKTST